MTQNMSAISSGFATSPSPILHLHELFEAQLETHADSIAISGAATLTYREVEEQTNRIAHRLRQHGVGPGKLVALLFNRSELPILAMLGVLKAGGGYIPLDPSYPSERMRYILTEAEACLVITDDAMRPKIDDVFEGDVLVLDKAANEFVGQPTTRLSRAETGLNPTDLCYVLFTSGTTGQPKGVMVEHRNAAQFAVAFNEPCQTTPADRIFQGFSLTFDGSVEEIWMAFSNGATLVVPESNAPRFGNDLAEYMNANGVTYFSTVPTMLTTMQEGLLPSLRQLVVSGEPCLPELVDVWATPNRLMLNVYGPTEATVNTTAFVCEPGKPVTIGKPLSGYKVHIFDAAMNPVEPGAKGELYVSGIGVTRGYLKRPDLTEGAYVYREGDDTRYYRAGDIARINEEGEIEFFGRADSQVKIRGYRVELSEIDSLLQEQTNVAIAITKLHKGEEQDCLASYVELTDPAQPLDRAVIYAELRSKLPPYMMPAFLEVIDALPRLTSGKVDKKSLPQPCTPLLGDDQALSLPQTEMQAKIAGIWQKLFHIEKIGIDQDFFLDLGGHSLLAAQMVAQLRKDAEVELPVRDVYNFPTIAGLADHLQQLVAAHGEKPKPPNQPSSLLRSALDEISQFYKFDLSNLFKYVWSKQLPDNNSFSGSFAELRTLCKDEREYHRLRNRQLGRPIDEKSSTPTAIFQATMILLFFVLLSWPFSIFITYADDILSGRLSLAEGTIYIFSFAIAIWPLILTLSIAAKWLIIGRYKPGSYPLWGNYYVRWWLVSGLQRLSGMSMFAGTPLMPIYYRLMGAKIGRDCLLDTAQCSIWDSVNIGSNSSIGADTQLLGYRIENGYLHIGDIEIGDRCFVGGHSVLGLNVTMGDDARLDEQSMLYDGEVMQAGEQRRGSPAKAVDVPVPAGDIRGSSGFRKAIFSIAALLLSIGAGLFLFIPPVLGLFVLIVGYQQDWFLTAVAVLFCSVPIAILIMCLWITLLKSMILRRAKPGVYQIYSFYYLRYWMARELMKSTSTMMLPVFTTIYLPPWMRLLGAKLGRHCELSTMWGFMPELITAGEGSFFADGCILGGIRAYGGRFEIRDNKIGNRSFIGNSAILPAGANVGNDCLLGVLSSPPLGSESVPDGSDWLGLPAFRLPNRQKVESFDDSVTFEPSRKLYLQRAVIDALRILIPAYISLALGLTGIATLLYLYQVYGLYLIVAVTPVLAISLAVTAVLLVVALKWAVMGRFNPVMRPLWSRYVWLNEMVNGSYESIMAPLTSILSGTPFAAVPLRMLGCRIGRHCYIASNLFSEFDLIEIGDYAAINEGAILQNHLFEDRIMKSSYLKIGDHCSVGNMAVVLYDTSMGDRAALGPLSLLMKGEIMPSDSKWYGSPTVHQ